MSEANLLQLQGGAKSFATKTLFEKATFAVNENEHIGVIGPNGTGKTTLFKIIAGEEELDHGEVIRSRALRIGYLKQHDTWNTEETLETYLERCERTPIWELKQLGHGLGLSDAQFEAPIKSLSGGYRMRAKLLYLLGEKPNLMLLDEPTNYLDLETTLVLEEFLQNFEGAFMLISHDREFLKRTTDHILEIETGDMVKFSGNIDDYFEQKQMLRDQLEARAMNDAAKRQVVLDFAARFGAKASKARQAQSRLKQMAKMETIELKSLPIGAKVHIPPPDRTGKLSMELKDVDVGYGEKVILQNVNLQILNGDHMGIVGLNGAGKTTLLKALAKEIPVLYGDLKYGYQLSCGYYAQHVSERLKPEETVVEALSRTADAKVKTQEILNIAGSLLFSGDDAKKKIRVLSGGEKARVALGQILLKRSPCLILDEPTNHLDFYTVEALTQSLAEYPGTVIIVSHDRGFIRRIATKIIEVHQGKVRLYPGAYDDYVWSVQKGAFANEPEGVTEFKYRKKSEEVVEEEDASSPVAEVRALAPVRSGPTPQKKELEARRREIDKALEALDKKTKILKSRMEEQAKTLESAQGAKATEISRELSASQKKIEELESEWMKLVEEREEILATIKSL
ncbi:MAG: ABC-F family ATP-binding cassette domain-containing protein [Deltaproteobacteria bacterium]|nr:ABC-F family ATP-binding cassette domain-containing protein [Deltaproteobacteria bacterium]